MVGCGPGTVQLKPQRCGAPIRRVRLMSIRIHCSHCGSTFQVNENLVGNRGKCPQCLVEVDIFVGVVVPPPVQPPPLRIVAPDVPAPLGAELATAGWSPLRGSLAIALGCLVVGIALLTAIGLTRRSKNPLLFDSALSKDSSSAIATSGPKNSVTVLGPERASVESPGETKPANTPPLDPQAIYKGLVNRIHG